MYAIHEDSVDDARYSLFDKAKKMLEMLPPITDALKLHIARAIYQAGICVRADVAIMDIEVMPMATNAWQDVTLGLEVVWKRVPTVPYACIELTSY